MDRQTAVRRRARVRQHAAGRDGDAARHLPRASARRLGGRSPRGVRLLRPGVRDHAGAHGRVRRARRQPVGARRAVRPRPDRARGVRRRGVSARRHGAAVTHAHPHRARRGGGRAVRAGRDRVDHALRRQPRPVPVLPSRCRRGRSARGGARAGHRTRRRVDAGIHDAGARRRPEPGRRSVSSAPSRLAALSPSSGCSRTSSSISSAG